VGVGQISGHFFVYIVELVKLENPTDKNCGNRLPGPITLNIRIWLIFTFASSLV
jgi:hypothetical protein